MVDIYFDHLLAGNFIDYSKTPLNEYSKNVYEVYLAHQNILPAGSSRFLEYVVKNNIYSAYSEIEGIQKVLFHLSGRIKHNVQLNESRMLFENNALELQTLFKSFFDEAMNTFLK